MPSDPQQQHHLLLKAEVSDDDNSVTDDRSITLEDLRKPKRQWAGMMALGALQLAVLAVYTAILFATVYPQTLDRLQKSYGRDRLLYNPMAEAYRYRVKQVGYNFTNENPFKGRSLAEIDQEWDHLLNGPHELRINEAELKKMNATSIQLSDGSGDYMIQPMAYHMLHCLYNMYKYVHPDFYGEDPDGPQWIVTHTDHCIDNLRQFVQCHGGNAFSTFKWLSWRKAPYAILTSQEVCIDWDHFDGWVRDHSITVNDITTLRDGHLLVHPSLGPVYADDLA